MAANPDSITGLYIRGELKIPVPLDRRAPNGKAITIRGATHNNLDEIEGLDDDPLTPVTSYRPTWYAPASSGLAQLLGVTQATRLCKIHSRADQPLRTQRCAGRPSPRSREAG